MMEFSLILPVLFLLLFGVFEFGLMMFGIATTRFAASDAARVESQTGVSQAHCQTEVPGCPKVFGNTKDACDADCQAIVSINGSALPSAFVQVNEIDVTYMVYDDSTRTFRAANNADRAGCPCINKYSLGGSTCCSTPNTTYPTSSRNVTFGQSDFLNVTITYQYNWLTGTMRVFLPVPQLSASYNVRIEPKKY